MKAELTEKFLDLRKSHIEKEFMHLNPMQREAVMATEGPLLILAGAGSGKTTVLINRIYNLMKYGCAADSDDVPEWVTGDTLRILEEGGEEADRAAALKPVEPWQILAITFTNKAAGELKNRLEKMLGEKALDIWACTFHSACLRILRRDCDRLGYTKNFTVFDTSDSVSMIRHILKDLDMDDKKFTPKAVLSSISNAKDKMLSPEAYKQAAEDHGNLHQMKIADIYREYQHRLNMGDAMDFDDLIYYTAMLLEEHEDVREHWQRRFRYVLIDEYQDTNTMQYRFAELISGGCRNICVVGDDDQSIYKFRGATIENILNFEERNPGCRTIRLEQNYRSTGHILQAANAVISHNTERKGKELWTEKEPGSKVELYVASSENEEAQYVASKLLAGYTAGDQWRDYAVLYRKNAQSNSIEYSLKRNGIPYRIVGGTRFFDRAEVKDILSYMCVISAPNDDLRLERIINNPPRGIGPKSVETAASIALSEGKCLYEVISRADNYPELARPAARMREFAAMIAELKDLSVSVTPDMLFDQIIEKSGYIRMLQEKNSPEERTKVENVQELKSTVISYMKESGDNTLSGYLANVALYTDLDNYDTEADAVTLMTVHSSKGLEFPHVFIVGMEENIFPSMQARMEPVEMEEERRLCYVAITRAMETLNLVCATQRMFFGQTSNNRISRFVEEIPVEDLHAVNVPRGYSFSTPENARRPRFASACSAARAASASSSSGASSSDAAGKTAQGTASPMQRRTGGFSSRSTARTGQHGGLNLNFHSGTEPQNAEQKNAAQQDTVQKNTALHSNHLTTDQGAAAFHEGDRVRHRAFQDGTIVSMKPMGGDFLVEISFDKIGTKKLMMKAAAAYMEKL